MPLVKRGKYEMKRREEMISGGERGRGAKSRKEEKSGDNFNNYNDNSKFNDKNYDLW